MSSEWFGPKMLCRAGIIPGSSPPNDTIESEKLRWSMVNAMKEGRNYIDRYMLDLLAKDSHVDSQVFAMLHTDENRLRDIAANITDNQMADDIESDGFYGLDEEGLDEMFHQRLKHRIRVVNRKRHIVRIYGPIPYSVGVAHVNINRGFYPDVSLVHHLPSIISAGYPAFSSPMPQEGNSPVSVNWDRYKEASQHWEHWGHKLSGADCNVWLENATKLNTTPETDSPEHHPLGKTVRLTWAALTLLRIIYGTDNLLATELAQRFQDQFPHAELRQWEPNTDGQHVDNLVMELD